jgi:hypothetical protein
LLLELSDAGQLGSGQSGSEVNGPRPLL